MVQSHCHVLDATWYLHVDPHLVDNCVPISAACHVVPRSSHAVASVYSRCNHTRDTLCLVMHRCRHARATLCFAGATLRSVCSLVVSHSDKTQSTRLAKLLLMPLSHSHVFTATFSYVATTCTNVEQCCWNGTKRDKTWTGNLNVEHVHNSATFLQGGNNVARTWQLRSTSWQERGKNVVERSTA
jgi:hypothetical protein